MSNQTVTPVIDTDNCIEFTDIAVKKPVLSLCAKKSATYKDGTCLWSIWLHALSHSSSRNVITLEKFRGTRDDAIKKLQEYMNGE